MPRKFEAGCKRPSSTIEATQQAQDAVEKGDVMIQVGKKAPDFELSGYIQGEFMNFKLSEYLGKWVVLCFYPGDFTFV